MGIETALLATAIIGAGISAYSQYKEGQDSAEAARYNAEVSRRNAEMSATMIEQSGALEVEQKGKEARTFLGTQKAKYGGLGVELTGSPLDVMIGTAANFELDKQIIEYNTKANALKTRYGGESQAGYDEKLASIYETSGTLRAGSTILTSASKIGSQYYTPSTKTSEGY